MGSSAAPRCSALFFIHKRSLKDLCIPTTQWETAQSGILLLQIILLIIPGGNLVLIINPTGRELILEREKRRKWMNEVMMFGLSLAFSPCRLVFKAGAPQNASGLFFMSVCQLSTHSQLATSCAIPQPPATPSYLYRHNINNWFHELLLHASLGMKAPDHRKKQL